MADAAGHKILILGATSPIARALALRFAQTSGTSLYLAARDAAEAARIAGDIAVRTGARVSSGAFEALDYGSHPALIEQAARDLGGLDGVVVAFGTLGDETVAQRDPTKAVEVIGQNFTGAASILTAAASRLESQQSGFVVVIGSVAGDRGRARNYVYGAAKGALALFAQGMRGRFSRSPIHVMTVLLGPVDTRMTWGREGTMMVVTPERAADAIYRAWRRKAEIVYVPIQWRLIMGVLKAIPEAVFKRLRF